MAINTITAEHKYIMGDNDSKNDARRMAFLEAKRRVLEKSGSFIETLTEVRNYQLSKDEIKSYSAALLKIETTKEKWSFVGENMAITVFVKALIDTSFIEKQFKKIKGSSVTQKKIKDQQDQLSKLEKIVVKLQKELGSKDTPEVAVLRKERNVVFKQIDALQAKKIAIMEKINILSKNIDLIEIGMTLGEVKSLLGKPRSNRFTGYNYGRYWIVIEGGIVNCINEIERAHCQSHCQSSCPKFK